MYYAVGTKTCQAVEKTEPTAPLRLRYIMDGPRQAIRSGNVEILLVAGAIINRLSIKWFIAEHRLEKVDYRTRVESMQSAVLLI